MIKKLNLWRWINDSSVPSNVATKKKNSKKKRKSKNPCQQTVTHAASTTKFQYTLLFSMVWKHLDLYFGIQISSQEL